MASIFYRRNQPLPFMQVWNFVRQHFFVRIQPIGSTVIRLFRLIFGGNREANSFEAEVVLLCMRKLLQFCTPAILCSYFSFFERFMIFAEFFSFLEDFASGSKILTSKYFLKKLNSHKKLAWKSKRVSFSATVDLCLKELPMC